MSPASKEALQWGHYLRACVRLAVGYTLFPMTTTLQKWGNSQGIRLPKPLVKALGLEESAEVELTLDPERDAIVLTAAKSSPKIRGRHRIEDLVAAMPRKYKAAEFGWEVSGKEVW